MEREIVVRGTGEARALPDPVDVGVAPMAAAAVVAGDAEPERVTPAELTVRVDVEVGLTILDVSGTADAD